MVGVACTGKGLLSGADPAWARGSPPAPLGALQETHHPPLACPSRCASGILSFPICKMGCLFHKSYTNHRGGPLQAALPASSSPFSARLRRLSQHRLFGFHRGLTSWGGLREVPSALTPPTRGGAEPGCGSTRVRSASPQFR